MPPPSPSAVARRKRLSLPEIRWRTARPKQMRDWAGYLKSVAFEAQDRLRPRPPDTPIEDTGFDLVTIVHGTDLGLLRLQARSLAIYLDPAFAGAIFVIVNDLALGATLRRIRRTILDDYGPWRDRVRLLPFTALGAGLDPANGWIFQQALKLALARIVSRPNYVVLDAKNHAIKPLSVGHFVTQDGRAIQQLSDCHPSMPEHQEACARYFGLDPADCPECATMTPFVLRTDLVRRLIRRIEDDEGRSIFAFFRQTRLLSEFKLYRLYLHAVHAAELDSHYVYGPLRAMTVWARDVGLKHTVDLAQSLDYVTLLGVHRNALNNLSDSDLQVLEAYWRRHHLLRPGETIRLVRG